MPFALLSQTVLDSYWIAQLLVSAGLITAALVLRWVLRRAVNAQHKSSPDLRRRWLLQVRNLTFLLIAIGLVLIWATELKTAAISVVALVVAIVLATKELILCLTGGFLKISSRMFSLGDHIEIGPVHGEVIDQTLLTTKLMETAAGPNGSQFTGRTVTIPNVLLLNQPVYNEALTKAFGLHVLTVPIKSDANWEQYEAALLAALSSTCAPYLAQAEAAVLQLAREEGLNPPSVEPRVHLALPEPGRVDLIARLPYPTDRKGKVLQQVMREYLRMTAELAERDENKSDEARS